jgi:uncharacterized protein YggU (UPF0235/DUF167 family)
MVSVHDPSAGVTFAVKVHPRAKRSAISGEVGDALKVSLTALPADGRANNACIGFFAKLLKVPRSSVVRVAGLPRRKSGRGWESQLVQENAGEGACTTRTIRRQLEFF